MDAQIGHVYFLLGYSSRLVKIGRARDLDSRISVIRCHSGDPLILLGAIPTDDPMALEHQVHDRFSYARAHGEWFTPTVELAAFIGFMTDDCFDDHWEITALSIDVERYRGFRMQNPDSRLCRLDSWLAQSPAAFQRMLNELVATAPLTPLPL